jgi:hypothetical protein
MISLGVFAQTDGLQKKNLEPFNKLIVSGDVKVYLKQSTENYISATEENFSMMSQQVSDNSLLISGGVDQVYVGVQNLNEIILNGTSDVYTTDTLRGETLKILFTSAHDRLCSISWKVVIHTFLKSFLLRITNFWLHGFIRN